MSIPREHGLLKPGERTAAFSLVSGRGLTCVVCCGHCREGQPLGQQAGRGHRNNRRGQRMCGLRHHESLGVLLRERKKERRTGTGNLKEEGSGFSVMGLSDVWPRGEVHQSLTPWRARTGSGPRGCWMPFLPMCHPEDGGLSPLSLRQPGGHD